MKAMSTETTTGSEPVRHAVRVASVIAVHRERALRRKRWGLLLRALAAVFLGLLLADLGVYLDARTVVLLVLFFTAQLAAAWLWSP